MSKAEILKKLYLYKQNPNLVKEVSNAELADLVVLVMTAVQSIEESMESKRVDVEKKYDTQAKQVLDKAEKEAQALLKEVTVEVNRLLDKGEQTLGQTATQLEQRVAESIANLRNGNDGIVTEAEIERAAAMALGMLELPDFDALVTEHITSNSEAIRDSLELLTGDDRYKVEIADVQGLAEALNRLSQLKGSSVGGIGKSQVYDFIRQAIADGTITSGGASTFRSLTDTPASYTGQAGKFTRVNAGEDGLEFATITGGGDLLATNNLSDVSNVATARTNLGLGTAAQSDTTDFAPALGADDNYVTDAEKTKLSNLSGTNTGDQDLSGYLTTATAASTYEPIKGVDDNYVTDVEKTKLGHISVTQAVNLDTMESDISSKIYADEALYYAIAF